MCNGGITRMAKLICMVGLPASGKSTFSKELSEKYNAVILSSDSIREELYGDENEQGDAKEVFELLHRRVNEYLSQGKNVVYDATNINRKRRIHLIKNEIKADEYICYYMNSPIGMCIHNDSQRGRTVGFDVINRMYKTMQIPIKSEGWDDVIIHNDIEPINQSLRGYFEEVINGDTNHDYLFEQLGKVITEFSDVHDLPHDSKYHTFSVSRHIYYTYKHVFDNYKGNRRCEMLVASLFHDIGKAHCKSFINHKGEETRTANYVGHEFVSAQIAMTELYHLGYSEEFITYVTTLVQLHMIPHNMSAKQEKKLRELLTEEQFEDLMFLNEADLQAH